MDIKDILENDSIKGLFDKFGVTEEQAKSVATQAVSSIKLSLGWSIGSISTSAILYIYIYIYNEY